ncbi:MAG: efflux RND transporter permease subunit, partial [Vicinamibacterales bacterium]
MTRATGLAGRLAAAFVQSKLTPLFMAASLALGALAVVVLPREEEPQIIVPMIDVFVEMPGASPSEVEQRVTRPMEKLLWEVPGVEYLYSTSSPGLSMVVVRFFVGEDEERALVRVYQKLAANMDRIPPTVSGPIVKPRSSDDVPILAVTLWGDRYDDFQLRQVAGQLHDLIKEVQDVSEVTVLGGRPREVQVELDGARLAAYGVDPAAIAQSVQASNARRDVAGPTAANRSAWLQVGNRLTSATQLEQVVVASHAGRPVLLGDLARVRDGDAEPTTYVR